MSKANAKRLRDEGSAEAVSQQPVEVMKFRDWYQVSKSEIGFTSIREFLHKPDDSLRDDVVSRLHMIATAISVRTEQMSLKNVLPPGFTAEYDDRGILETSVIYGGELINNQKALNYLALYQLAKIYHAIHTVRLQGGAVLIIKPYQIKNSYFVTNSRVVQFSPEVNPLLMTAISLMVQDLDDLNPYHYTALALKTLTANKCFQKCVLKASDWESLNTAIESRLRAEIERICGKASNPSVKAFIRAVDDIVSNGSTLEEICNPDNLGMYTKKSLISLLSTQGRLYMPYRTKRNVIYLDSERATKLEPQPISSCTNDQHILVMKNAMGHSAYGKLTGSSAVYAVPAGTETFYVPYGSKGENLAERGCKLLPACDFKTVVAALANLSVSSIPTPAESAAAADSATSSTDTPIPIAQIDDSMFE